MTTLERPVRVERDVFGEVKIPADRYWGAQTQRALELFAIGEERFPIALVRAFGLQKLAAARANRRLGVLEVELAAAIEAAAEEVREGKFDADFPLTIWQTGSGTQTNMNANEVIANRANERLGRPLGTKSPVHPNDHVNRSQSSNDSFPTVMHLASALELRDRLIPALTELNATLAAKAAEFDDIIKIGRTHLMDAVPMTMGQAFDAFARQVANGIARIEDTLPRLLRLPQGGSRAPTQGASGAEGGEPDESRCRPAARGLRPPAPPRQRRGDVRRGRQGRRGAARGAEAPGRARVRGDGGPEEGRGRGNPGRGRAARTRTAPH